MAQPGSDEDKSHEPTQKKLEDARKKGDVPRSVDLTTAASYAGFLVVAVSTGADSLSGLGAVLASLLDQAEAVADDMFSGGGQVLAGGLMGAVMSWIGPWFLLPAVAALLAVFAMRSFTVTPERLKPKRAGLFEFSKSFTKLGIYSAVLGVFLWRQLPAMIETIALSSGLAVVVLLDLCVRFSALVLVIALVIGGVDYLWQRQEHLRQNRMSHRELVDEAKQSEGDPQVKQQRRQKGYEIATNRMLADVPGADVVVVNPSHFAVALKWERGARSAPVCVAKGVDELAARIREKAAEAGVPIHRDPPTARALHATVEIGHEIRPEHYRPVAAAIRFAEAMRLRAGGRVTRGPRG
jgi:flagellar biosynthetic protein FlhB